MACFGVFGFDRYVRCMSYTRPVDFGLLYILPGSIFYSLASCDALDVVIHQTRRDWLLVLIGLALCDTLDVDNMSKSIHVEKTHTCRYTYILPDFFFVFGVMVSLWV